MSLMEKLCTSVTQAGLLSSCVLGVQKEEAPEKLEALFTPIVSSMAGAFQPLKNWMHLHADGAATQVGVSRFRV